MALFSASTVSARSSLLVSILSAVLLLPVPQVFAESFEQVGESQTPTSASELVALQTLVARLEMIRTISGDFVQHSVDQKGVRLQEARGNFKAQRPGKFYWYTAAPLEQTVFSDGITVTVYDPDLEQATVQPATKEIDNTPAILFSGDIDTIGQLFRVEERLWGDGNDKTIAQYVLFPTSPDSLYAQLRVRFENETITEMRLLDSLGQQNTITFENVEMNPDLPAKAFAPKLPDNTDIIREVPVTPAADKPAKAK